MADRTAPAATPVQTDCERCGATLVPHAAYCNECGTRTRSAARKVRIALRLELVFLGLIVAMLAVFAYINLQH